MGRAAGALGGSVYWFCRVSNVAELVRACVRGERVEGASERTFRRSEDEATPYKSLRRTSWQPECPFQNVMSTLQAPSPSLEQLAPTSSSSRSLFSPPRASIPVANDRIQASPVIPTRDRRNKRVRPMFARAALDSASRGRFLSDLSSFHSSPCQPLHQLASQYSGHPLRAVCLASTLPSCVLPSFVSPGSSRGKELRGAIDVRPHTSFGLQAGEKRRWIVTVLETAWEERNLHDELRGRTRTCSELILGCIASSRRATSDTER